MAAMRRTNVPVTYLHVIDSQQISKLFGIAKITGFPFREPL